MTLVSRNDVTFNSPVRYPKAEGYNIKIDERWWRTVAAPGVEIQVGSKDSLAKRTDDQGSIYENVLDLGYAWARTDMSGGEGLDWDPPEIPIQTILTAQNPRRYWNSKNIDVSRPAAGERYELKLAKAMDEWNPTKNNVTSVASSSAAVYINDDDWVYWYDDWDNLFPLGSHQIVPGTDVLKLVVTPDDRVIALLANGDLWQRQAGGASFTLFYDSTVGPHGDMQDVWYAKGRIISWDSDGDLHEMPWDGTTPVVIESMQSELIVYSVVESGPCVVAAVSDGTIRTYNSVVVSGVPELTPAARTDVPIGEIPYLLGANAGRLLYLTADPHTFTVRLYQATVLDDRYDYIIGEIQLRREWFDTFEVVLDGVINHNMFPGRDALYFMLDEQSGSSLWAYDLVTQGLSRINEAFTSGVTSSITGFHNRIAVVSSATGTVHVESDTDFAAMGYIISPNITFGLNTDISWLATVLEVANIVDGDIQVELQRSTDPEAILDPDHASWMSMVAVTSQTTSGEEIPLVNTKSRTLALQLKLWSTAGNTRTPKVTRMAIRGIPSHRDLVLIVPINVSDYVSVPGRKPYRIAGLGDKLQQDLFDLLGESVEAHVLNPTVDIQGIVNNISEPIQLVSDRGSVSRYCFMEIRGQRITGTGITIGTGGIGLDWMGMATMGIGEE